MPILTKQFITSFLKNGKWTNFSILKRDSLMGSRSSWLSMYFCTFDGLFLNLSVSESPSEEDLELLLDRRERRDLSLPLPELELELDLCLFFSSFATSFLCLSASLRSFSCLLAFNSLSALDF